MGEIRDFFALGRIARRAGIRRPGEVSALPGGEELL